MQGLHWEPVGIDFSRAVAEGLRARLAGQPPEAMARVTLLTNTSRLARRVEASMVSDGPTLLPRIGLLTDVAGLLPPGDAATRTIDGLALRLRLTRLVAGRLEADPDLSPVAAAFDLADSLAKLMSEFEEERCDAEAFSRIEAGDLAEHWDRSLKFLKIATDWIDAEGELTPAGAHALNLQRLTDHWRDCPPEDPIIIAGSTGSRAPTRLLIEQVLRLPQGVVILPGVDDDMPEAAWAGLTAGTGQQDHPQYRHAALLEAHAKQRGTLPRWSGISPASPARNRLISLALRPAPATDAWLEEGGDLRDVDLACSGVTLVKAPSPGAEARAIACGLRGALQAGRRAALITPDRTLARQVTAQLARWDIRPDDSAGQPLNQSAPARLLLHAAEMRGRPVESEPLAILLSHPLTQIAGNRVEHLRSARAFEVALLRQEGLAFPTRASVEAWLDDPETRAEHGPWSDWLCGLLDEIAAQPAEATLAEHLRSHMALVACLAGAPGTAGEEIWTGDAGRALRVILDNLARAAGERGPEKIAARDYIRILKALMTGEEVRDRFGAHPDVMIWGALEARARNADLVILGGLNDDIWPGAPLPDPWLNRTMRAEIGLRVPDREVGLSAHDFQQAAAGPEVWLSRALRTEEAETVPSRWLNRIEGLLQGIGEKGHDALRGMRARGDDWLAMSAALDRPDARHPATPAPRPGPVLPKGTALERISATGVETLIRDPYTIYARDILRLRTMPALRIGPDARLRGSAIHDAMERFTRAIPGTLPQDADRKLMDALENALAEHAPWPGHRRLWLGKFARVVPALLEAEAERRAVGTPLLVEGIGRREFEDPPFTLVARADRIDACADGVAIYDYKTGTLPSPRQQRQYAKQLLLEALMIADGAFADVPQRQVREVAYLRIGSDYGEARPEDFGPELIDETRRDLIALMRRYADGAPFIARLASEWMAYASDYDLLSRYGEWDDTQAATRIPVGCR